MLSTCCDYCLREFGYRPGSLAVCMNCGLENVRPAQPKLAEIAMRPGAAEHAMRPASQPRRRKRA